MDLEKEFLEISKNRKLEILDSQVAENYRKKISGFETKNQLKEYLSAEPQPKEKVALGYVRSKDLGKLKKTNTFYFHASFYSLIRLTFLGLLLSVCSLWYDQVDTRFLKWLVDACSRVIC